MDLFRGFVEKLAKTPDGDGTLLDHSLILYGSGMSESDTHSRLNIPTLLVGKGAGMVKGNQHIVAPKETPMANFLLDLANKFGSDAKSFGHQHHGPVRGSRNAARRTNHAESHRAGYGRRGSRSLCGSVRPCAGYRRPVKSGNVEAVRTLLRSARMSTSPKRTA